MPNATCPRPLPTPPTPEQWAYEHLCALRDRLQADADVLRAPRPGGRNNSLSPRRYPIGSAGYTTERRVAKEFAAEQVERQKAAAKMLEPLKPAAVAEAPKPAEEDPFGDFLSQQQAAQGAADDKCAPRRERRHLRILASRFVLSSLCDSMKPQWLHRLEHQVPNFFLPTSSIPYPQPHTTLPQAQEGSGPLLGPKRA